MSKKKASSGNTMTLKDFHGGSIPSDLPLPSAPGLVVRSTNDHRSGFDRQTTPWGNPGNRALDHRLRPGSSGSMRSNGFDDKSLFLSDSASIGRNFDEDERKPLDGGPTAPRRLVSDDIVRGPVISSETRGHAARVAGVRENSGLGSGGSSYSARVVDGANLGAGSVGVRPNAWGVRKEVPGIGVNEMMSFPSVGGQSTVSKFVQASALDKISSGRWQTKPTHHKVDVEVIRQSDSPTSLYSRESEYIGSSDLVSERGCLDTTLVTHMEIGLAIEDGVRGSYREVPGIERVHSPGAFDGKERSSVLFTNNDQPAYPEGRYSNSESLVPPEEKMSEKPKLKLLPRTKTLSVPEPPIIDYKQGPQQLISSSLSETSGRSGGNGRYVKPGLASNEVSPSKSGLSSSEAANQAAERPKLNLKPRSHPLDQSEVNTERERIPLFGGARPRETVLMERGVDDVLDSHDEVQGPSRTIRYSERGSNHPVDHRAGRVHEKKDQLDVQKAQMQKKNWRNENWRSIKDTEKLPQKERPPSPETWRKPVDQSKPADAYSLRFGKAVSAIELAQAFSKPVSIPEPVDHFSGHRRHPGRTQIPFSRLTSSTARPQVNGF